jgi:integrase
VAEPEVGDLDRGGHAAQHYDLVRPVERKAFRTLILRLEKEGRIAPGLTLYGRRHTLGDALADLGAEPRMIQAVLGHRSMPASLHYSAGADRKRAAAAAVHLLETNREHRTGGFGKNGKLGENGK